MPLARESARELPVMALETKGRFIQPSEQEINEMAKSLEAEGQLCPIAVRRITSKEFQVVFGATRVFAARQLGLPKLRAEIVSGTDDDYLAAELTECLGKKISAAQRRTIKQRLRELRRNRLNNALQSTPASKGGRGKKGGCRGAARAAGVASTTAHRDGNKLFQNGGSGTVSFPAPKLHSTSEPKDTSRVQPRFDNATFERIKQWGAERNINATQSVKQLAIIGLNCTREGR
jgi:hypothetical protein